MGGTSAGSALAAAFALGAAPEAIDRAIGDIFVANRSFRRYTLPRYSLVDHTHFDRHLVRHFGEIDIEDLWIPYFAVSTNLSTYDLHRHRRGPLWAAIRASAAIPVLLPPYYTRDGHMLVDGCLLDNVPIRVMHEIKSGPNVVVSFRVPDLERFEVDYDTLPSRTALLGILANPLRYKELPRAPGLHTVLLRSLMTNRQDFKRHLTRDDLVLVPPVPADMGLLDWHRHTELMETACSWAREELARLGETASLFRDARGHGPMKAMVLDRPGTSCTSPSGRCPRRGRARCSSKVAACGVCRTDLHVVDGDLREPRLADRPGTRDRRPGRGAGRGRHALRDRARVGIPWLGHTCGACFYCRTGRENLCDRPGFTGYQIDGGYADYAVADAAYTFPIPDGYSDAEAAPLLCAGLIGYRALRAAGEADRLGLYGFGAAAHIVVQVARQQGRRVFAFTRPGDAAAQAFARALGAEWTGGSDETPPEALDAAIIFAPVGALVPAALRAVRKGGTVVLAGIHMSEIPALPYEILWGERVVRSVANLTRRDAEEFLALAPKVPVRTHVVTFPLAEANLALARLRSGELTGAAVLIPGAS